jgi:hypothetical protein
MSRADVAGAVATEAGTPAVFPARGVPGHGTLL